MLRMGREVEAGVWMFGLSIILGIKARVLFTIDISGFEHN
jgi:hypothetical protein